MISVGWLVAVGLVELFDGGVEQAGDIVAGAIRPVLLPPVTLLLVDVDFAWAWFGSSGFEHKFPASGANREDACREIFVQLLLVRDVDVAHCVVRGSSGCVAVCFGSFDGFAEEVFCELWAKFLPFQVPGRKFGFALLEVQAGDGLVRVLVGDVFSNAVVLEALFKFRERSHAEWADPRFGVLRKVVACFDRFALFAQVRLWLVRVSCAQVTEPVATELVAASFGVLDELELAVWASPGFRLNVLGWPGAPVAQCTVAFVVRQSLADCWLSWLWPSGWLLLLAVKSPAFGR